MIADVFDTIAGGLLEWLVGVSAAALVSTVGLLVRRWWQHRGTPPVEAEEAPEALERIDVRQPRIPREGRSYSARPNLEPLPGLVGREDDIEAVRAKIEGTEPWGDPVHERRVVVVVRGPRGIGTSWCARQAGRTIQRTGQFPDGVILVDMQDPTTKERGLLQTVAHHAGTDDIAPADDAIGAGELSDRLSDKDLLVVVDNVDAREDIAPLLQTDLHLLIAASPAFQLGRAGAALHRLGPLATDAAVGVFLAAHTRPVDDAESDDARQAAAEQVVTILGGRPGLVHELAATVECSAGQLAANLTAAVATPPFARCDQTGEDSLVHTVCVNDVGYRNLGGEGRRTVRLLSTTSGALDPDALAVLLGPEATPPWRELAVHGFVRRGDDDRDDRRLSPDVWRLARLHLVDEESDETRLEAYANLVHHLAPQAAAAMTALTTTTDPERRRGRPAGLPFVGTPHAWLARQAELIHELVVAPAPPERDAAALPPGDLLADWFSLAQAVCVWYEHDHQPERAKALCSSVLATAEAAGLGDVEGWAHGELGKLTLYDDPQTALRSLYIALDRLGHHGEAAVRANIAAALLQRGHDEDVDEALGYLTDARPHLEDARGRDAGTIARLFGEVSYRQAELRDRSGRLEVDDDEEEEAKRQRALFTDELAEAERQLVLASDLLADRDPAGYAETLNTLVLVYTAQESHRIRPPHRHPRPGRDARRVGRVALAAYEDRDDPEGQARSRLNLAIVALSITPAAAAEARDLLDENLVYLRDQPSSRLLARSHLYLGDALEALGEPPEPAWRKALEVATEVADTRTVEAVTNRLEPNGSS